MRVLVVAESQDPGGVMGEGLQLAGHEVTACLDSSLALLRTTEEQHPEAIVIQTGSPSRELLERLALMSEHGPRPVVMFASDSAPDTIRAALKAGVCAYLVNGLDVARLRTIIDVAVARFEDFQRLRAELAAANEKLGERKLIERAKGVLMRAHGLDEEAAYALMRKAAMDRKQRLAEVAAQLLGA